MNNFQSYIKLNTAGSYRVNDKHLIYCGIRAGSPQFVIGVITDGKLEMAKNNDRPQKIENLFNTFMTKPDLATAREKLEKHLNPLKEGA